MTDVEKQAVQSFWDRAACGEEAYARGSSLIERLRAQSKIRYALEPYLKSFARFSDGSDKDVLEIGVGMGADHLEWARSRPRSLTGIDLTPRAIGLTRERLALEGKSSHLQVADAEHLPFADDSFDLVYSWGVLHHSPGTDQAVHEVYRVLRTGGVCRVMIYHRRSLVGAMLWVRYAALAGRPQRSLDEIYAEHLESPGTKAYSIVAARRLFADFRQVKIRSQLSFGDLLHGEVGQRHRGPLLTIAKRLYPRSLVSLLLRDFGLYLLIEAHK